MNCIIIALFIYIIYSISSSNNVLTQYFTPGGDFNEHISLWFVRNEVLTNTFYYYYYYIISKFSYLTL